MFYGARQINDLLTFTVNTHLPASGAAADADSPPTYRVYEDETTAPILTGSMVILDDTNTTGLYSEQITLSAANGFEVGKSYSIYVSATVGSITGTMSHAFQIIAAPALASAVAVVATYSSEVWKLMGLDIANPMTVTPAARSAGAAVVQVISGDGTTTSTVTRQP